MAHRAMPATPRRQTRTSSSTVGTLGSPVLRVPVVTATPGSAKKRCRTISFDAEAMGAGSAARPRLGRDENHRPTRLAFLPDVGGDDDDDDDDDDEFRDPCLSPPRARTVAAANKRRRLGAPPPPGRRPASPGGRLADLAPASLAALRTLMLSNLTAMDSTLQDSKRVEAQLGDLRSRLRFGTAGRAPADAAAAFSDDDADA